MPTVAQLLTKKIHPTAQVIVTGKPIHPELSLEIIRRTDDFFKLYFPNGDTERIHAIRKAAGMPIPLASKDPQDLTDYFEKFDQWTKAWNLVDGDYTSNNWIYLPPDVTAWGWCHPNGQIGSWDNLRFYPPPTPTCLANEWWTIAKAFPFLEMGITVMTGPKEEKGSLPMISFLIQNGRLSTFDPETKDVHAGHPLPEAIPEPCFFRIPSMARQYRSANEIPLDVIQLWGRRICLNCP